MKTKQVLVMRTKFPNKKGDTISPRKGKFIAQGSHGAMSFLSRRMRPIGNKSYQIDLTDEEEAWFKSSYAKIVLQVETDEELLEIYKKAKDADLEVHLVTDNGLTEFDGPQNTCVAIGPDECSKIDEITGHLKPL